MTEKVYLLNVYNTCTGQYERIQVTKEVFNTYRQTQWQIEHNDKRFFKNEIQMSSLIGAENNGYERFDEFTNYDNTPEDALMEEWVEQYLHNLLALLPPDDYVLIYALYFQKLSEGEYGHRLGISQQAVNKRKKRILRKLHCNFETEGC